MSVTTAQNDAAMALAQVRRGLSSGSDSSSSSSGSSSSSANLDVLLISLRTRLCGEDAFKTRLEASLIIQQAQAEADAEAEAELAAVDLGSTNSNSSSSSSSSGSGPGRLFVMTPRDMALNQQRWSPAEDRVLLDFINGDKKLTLDKGLADHFGRLVIPRRALAGAMHTRLDTFNLLEMHCRMLVIEAFNRCLETVLPIVNLQSADPLSLGAALRRCSHYVLLSTKEPMLAKVIESTAAGSGTSGLPAALVLDNNKALDSREKGEVSISKSQACFVQAFRQLRDKDSVIYRYTFSGDRVFSINFHGESGIDAGGVWREGVSRIVEDLFSPHLNLLLLCPNGQHETHTNMDKYVPNPAYTSGLALEMFEFVGRLMAMSLRAKCCLPFEFPSIVWKQLVGEATGMDDLLATDAITCHLLRAVRDCEKDGIVNEAMFHDAYGDKLRWTFNGSDGLERELRKGSGGRAVTWAQRHDWCDAVERCRLGEFDVQVAAIRRGMDSVVPLRVLQIFTWQQLEVLVSGDPRIDIELWKNSTDSSGVSGKLSALFWKVMESLTATEQSGFIRFAWGRSRLPPASDFTTKMKLTRLGTPGARLPVAHTCFFSVELPEYGTEEEMRTGLLTAINFGMGGILLG